MVFLQHLFLKQIIHPSVGGIRVVKSLITVDFPAPFGPKNPKLDQIQFQDYSINCNDEPYFLLDYV